jgi:hypothetical protein
MEPSILEPMPAPVEEKIEPPTARPRRPSRGVPSAAVERCWRGRCYSDR